MSLPSAVVKTAQIVHLVFGSIALLLAAFCAAWFSAVFAYATVWWSVSDIPFLMLLL